LRYEKLVINFQFPEILIKNYQDIPIASPSEEPSPETVQIVSIILRVHSPPPVTGGCWPPWGVSVGGP